MRGSAGAPRWLLAGLAALCLLSALAPWLLSQRSFPGEAAEVTALYRPGGDIQYYEIGFAIGGGNLGESNLLEHAGEGLVSFPLATMLVHSLALHWLGAWGVLAADALMTLLFFGLFYALLRALLVEPLLAAFAAAAVVLGTDFVNAGIAGLLGKSPFRIWGHRLPRPFVSESFLVVCLLCAVQLAKPHRTRQLRWWLGLGIGGALLLQGDVHAAVAVSLLALGLVGWCLVRSPDGRGVVLRNATLAGAAAAVVASPLALQLLSTSPDVQDRFGSFPVDRIEALGWALQPYTLAALPVLLLGGAMLLVLRRLEPEGRERRLALAVLMALAVVGTLALPTLCTLLGQGIHLYHFRDRLTRYASYLALVVVLYGVELLARRLPSERRRRATLVAGSAVVALAAAAQLCFANGWASTTAHARASYFRFETLGNYRRAFGELAAALREARADGDLVLGTFDHQVHVYWQAFCGGYNYVPDAFTTLVPDATIERRLVGFAHVLGLSPEGFRELLGTEYVNVFFWGSSRFQANRAKTYAPLEEYTPEQRRRIRQTSIFSTWSVEVPPAEYARLDREFRSWRPAADPPRLDLIVLANDGVLSGAEPDPARFREILRNRVFRAWRRR